MKRTILAVLLVLAILGVCWWGADGWLRENNELQQLQREYQTVQQQNEALRRQKTVLEGELADLQQQNGEANETLQSWKSWKEDLQAAIAGE